MSSRELYKQVDFKQNLKLYWKIGKPYKWFFLVILLLSIVYEIAHLGEKYLFKIILDKGSEFVAGSITQQAITQTLIFVALVFTGIFIFKALNHWIRITLTNKLEAGMILDLKQRFFNHIVQLSHSFHTTHKTGSLISKMNRGSGALERLTDFFIYSLAPVFIQIAVASVSIVVLQWQAAVVMILTAVAFITFGLWVSNIQKQAHIDANNAEDREKGTISDVFTNIDSIKYFGKEKLIRNRYEKVAKISRDTRLKFWNYGRIFSVGISVIVAVGTFFIFYFPLKAFLAGNLTIGSLAFIYTVYGGIMGPLWGFVHSIRGFYISLGDFDALFQYENIKNEIKDPKKSKKLKISQGSVDFNNVIFSYHGKRKNKAIQNLSLKINKNEKVALVGHSGCGKTTLMKLLYRFYDVDSGEILIDGKNIKGFDQESLRSELSIVPQEAILFDDTIYNNIKFSNPSATKSEVMKAMKFAQLDNFVSELPLKEQTIVGERGVKLSGGEKQRVSIARAILADKKILVLDEATSALDSQTEFEIQQALERLMKGRTSIIIAHRLSTIMKADKIVVMEKGKVAQVGKHRDLIKQPGIYKQLWNFQKGGYIKE